MQGYKKLIRIPIVIPLVLKVKDRVKAIRELKEQIKGIPRGIINEN